MSEENTVEDEINDIKSSVNNDCGDDCGCEGGSCDVGKSGVSENDMATGE
jgi:hypothetical protein